LIRVATLGAELDGRLKREPLWMARDRRGRYFVTYTSKPDLASAFDSTGRFLQEIGRKGSGPAEFVYPMTVNVDTHDRLILWDVEGMRESVFDQDLHFTRSYIQRSATLFALPDGRHIASFSALDASDKPAPLSVFDSVGARVRSFGASNVVPPDGDAWRGNRVVGPGANGTVWVSRTDMYRLERWDTSGRLLQTFVRAAAWFPLIARRANWVTGDEPTPIVRAIREDRSGHLMLLVSVAAPDWRSALGKPRLAPGKPAAYPERIDARVFDTMLDVIDTKTGKLVSSQRLRGLYKFFLADDLVASYRQDNDGNPFIDVWRVVPGTPLSAPVPAPSSVTPGSGARRN